MRPEDLLRACFAFSKEARKHEDLAVLEANIGNYIHFSSSERLGISYGKNIHPGNPKAVYGFPLTTGRLNAIKQNKIDAFEGFGYSKYIYIFSCTGKILDIDNIDLEEITKRIREFATSKYGSNYHLMYSPRPRPYTPNGGIFLEWLKQIFTEYQEKGIFKNEHNAANILLRGIGYDALETKKFGFGDDMSSQIAIMNPNAVNLIAKINNPMMSKEDIKEIDWYNSEEYKVEQENKRKAREQAEAEREAKWNAFEKERDILNQMDRQLREERKKGITPDYLKRLEELCRLEKELNQKFLQINAQSFFFQQKE